MRTVGRYVLHSAIASGGMGTVHLGCLVGAAGFSRTVAIKAMLETTVHDIEFVAMFVDEARLAARVKHPNVVQTLDVVHEGSDLLLVMDYIHGESLARVARFVEDGRPCMPPSIAAAIMCDALDGLHAAHEATDTDGTPLGMVHRDVSPQNVIVGVDGVARVLDFGVAKAKGRLHTTRDGDVKGKLSYMAPEQFRGQEVDRRTDIFAASAVLWELLTGRRLFAGTTEGETISLVLSHEIASPAHLVAGIPAALDDLVMRGLARTAAERFATAHEMARALERALPLARRSEIGAWLTTIAGPSLAERAALVAALERTGANDSSANAARVVAEVISSPDVSGVVTAVSPPANPSEVAAPMAKTGDRTAAAVVTSRAPGPITSARRRALVAVVALVTASAAASVALLLRGTGGARPVLRGAASGASSSMPVAAASGLVAPPPSAPPSASASPADSVAPDGQKAEPSARPAPAPRRPAAPATAKPAHAVDCREPCAIDDRGVKVCKPECLR